MTQKKKSAYRAVRGDSSGTTWLILCILILLAFGAALVSVSPVGQQLQEKATKWTEAIVNFRKGTETETKEVFADTTPQPSASPTEEPIQTETLLIEAVPFYILQMGSYEKSEEATLVSAQNQAMGGAGYVWETDGIYRLMAAAYTDESSLRTVQQQIRKDGYENDAFVTNPKTILITMQGDAEAVQIGKEAIALLSELPEMMCDLTLQYDLLQYDQKDIASKLSEQEKQISDLMKQLEAMDAENTGRIQTTLEIYENAISTFLKSHDSMKKEYYTGSLRHLQLEIIEAYTRLFEE